MKWGISKLALRETQTKAISQSASYFRFAGRFSEIFYFPFLSHIACHTCDGTKNGRDAKYEIVWPGQPASSTSFECCLLVGWMF